MCPGGSDPFYIVTYYTKWVTTSKSDSTVMHPLLPKGHLLGEFSVNRSFYKFCHNYSGRQERGYIPVKAKFLKDKKSIEVKQSTERNRQV